MKRNHHKSRAGCLACRKRRVKCDEIHPVCKNCSRRQEECSWPLPENWPKPPSSLSGQNPALASPPTTDAVVSELSNMALLHHYTSHCALNGFQTQEVRQMNQLELPRIGFKHPFLLHTLLAAAALDLATTYGTDDPGPHNMALFRKHMDLCLNIPPATKDKELDQEEGMAHFVRFGLVAILALSSPDVMSSDWEPKILTWIEYARDAFLNIHPSWTELRYPIISSCLHVMKVLSTDHRGYFPSTTSSLHPSIRCIHVPAFGAPDSYELDDPVTCDIYSEAVHKLDVAFGLFEQADLSVPVLVSVGLIWSHTFMNLVRARRPRALAILAHYYVLYTTICCFRGIKRYPQDDISKIFAVLNPEWRTWLSHTLPAGFQYHPSAFEPYYVDPTFPSYSSSSYTVSAQSAVY